MTFKHKQKQTEKQSEHHVFVATPAYDGKVECNYSQSLAEASFCAPLYGVRVTASVMGNGAFIDLARNIFAKRFLEETDCSHLFFIDADLRFQPNAFIGLIQANMPICAGVYRRRQEPEDYPCVYAENPNGGGFWVENDWVMCKRAPTGFLCIRRDIVEEMSADAPKIEIHGQKGLVPWLFHTKFQDAGGLKAIAEKFNLSAEFLDQYGGYLPTDGCKFVGEDYGFSDDYVKKYNGKCIPIWPNFDFIHGGYKGNLSEFLARMNKATNTSEDTSSAA